MNIRLITALLFTLFFLAACTTINQIEKTGDSSQPLTIKHETTEKEPSTQKPTIQEKVQKTLPSETPESTLPQTLQQTLQPTPQKTTKHGIPCTGTKTTFSHAPVNLEKTELMVPLGLMSGSHVTPVDHNYFQDFDNKKVNIEVYSPGDGVITHMQHMPGAPENEDYRLVIQHTCTISSIFIHIHTLSNKLKTHATKTYSSPNIPVQAGELLGYYGTNVDYNVVDEEVTLQGFISPELYKGEPWKIHVPNTFDYFTEPVKSQLKAKILRTKEPLNGKIDYDTPTKLVGNWFVQNTNGYRGNNPHKYWSTHLAIAYDHIDPTRIVFSIPGYTVQDSKQRESEQFTIKGNAPDPKNIGTQSSIVKYELVRYDYFTPSGDYWDRKSLVKGLTTKEQGRVEGTVLAQVLENEKLKFEVFEGKKAHQVSKFTKNVRVYER